MALASTIGLFQARGVQLRPASLAVEAACSTARAAFGRDAGDGRAAAARFHSMTNGRTEDTLYAERFSQARADEHSFRAEHSSV